MASFGEMSVTTSSEVASPSSKRSNPGIVDRSVSFTAADPGRSTGRQRTADGGPRSGRARRDGSARRAGRPVSADPHPLAHYGDRSPLSSLPLLMGRRFSIGRGKDEKPSGPHLHVPDLTSGLSASNPW